MLTPVDTRGISLLEDWLNQLGIENLLEILIDEGEPLLCG